MGSEIGCMRRALATLFVCSGAALCPLVGAASAQVYTWTGGSPTSQNWSEAANWSQADRPPAARR
jgi:hypothetical protein